MRRCILDPVPEIHEAARYLDEAVSAHLGANHNLAAELIKRADMAAIRLWTEALWGRSHRVPQRSGEIAVAVSLERVKERMPSAAEKIELIRRDGYHCRFCGIPVIRKEVRERIRKSYPVELRWGKKNCEQHTAFQAMWLQYDHISAHAHGGTNDLSNIVITCAPCNFARMDDTLEAVSLIHPLTHDPVPSIWDGLERFR